MKSFHCLLSLVLILFTTGPVVVKGFQLPGRNRATSSSRKKLHATTFSLSTSVVVPFQQSLHYYKTSTTNSYPNNNSNIPTALSLFQDDTKEAEQESLSSSSSSNAVTSSSPALNHPILLATIDFVALVLFAGIGKANHDTTGSIDVSSTLNTAAPFLLSWYATSPFTGIYNHHQPGAEDEDSIWEVGKIVVRGWIVAIPLGCVLRGILKGYVPPVPFVVVTMIATLILLGGTRMLYAAAVKNIS
jgi:hypothetical protein